MTYSSKGKISIPQGKEKLQFLCSYVLLKLINHGIRLKTRTFFFIWPSLFSCNTKVNLNYCVGVKEKWPKKSCRNQDTEAVARMCPVKKVFLEMSQNSQENTCVRISLLKKRLWHRCFPMNFVTFLRTPFFTKHLWWLLLRIEILKLRNFNIKTNFRCYTNHIWEFVANVK